MRAEHRRFWSALAIPAALALFLALNWLAGTTLTQARLDLTEDRLYTLSDATKRVLSSIEEPIVLSYYRSEAISGAGPQLVDYARRVRETLRQYVRLSDGKLKLEIYRPEPFSAEEDQAVAAGLRGVQLGEAEGTAYFGLAGHNSTDDRETIPVFSPERAQFLEYDLTRLVDALAKPEHPTLGIVTSLPMQGDPAAGVEPWRVVELLRQGYDVQFLRGDRNALPEDLDALMLAQASGMSGALEDSIAAFADAGKPVVAFVDPFSETLAARRGPGDPPPPDAVTELAPLLMRWGVRIAPDTIVGDRPNARRVRARVQGRESTIDYLPWIGVPAESLAADDPATANLAQVAMNAAGSLRGSEAGDAALAPLATTSPRAMEIPVEKIATRPDPAQLLSDFRPQDTRYVLAARVGGAGRNIAVIADADLLDDAVWTQRRQVMGEEVAVAMTNNGDFVVNLLDSLTGGQDLLALRGRGLSQRPFTVIEEMREAAETRYRAREQALSKRVHEAEQRIQSLRRTEKQTGVVLSDAEESEIERLRGDMLEARGELRQVQHQLHAEVEALQRRVRLAVTWGMPALVALVAVVLALLRRRRRGRRPVASG